MKMYLAAFLVFVAIPGAFAIEYTPADLQKVQVPTELRKGLKSFEPSSAIYLSDLDKYLISSDDTDKKETPYLFLMDDKGQVDSTPLRVQGIAQMTDIESISQDDQGRVYLLSSLSINKNGRNKPSRNMFVEVARQGRSLTAFRTVELRSLLVEKLRQASLPGFERAARDLGKELDIESHFILKGELHVGLKNPQPRRDQALIVNLGSVEVLLSQKRIEKLSVWRVIDFSVAGSDCLLSDMQMDGDDLYLTTTSDQGDPGHLWHMDVLSGKLTKMHSFAGVKPEGLALRPQDDAVMVVFDQGVEETYFFTGRRF